MFNQTHNHIKHPAISNDALKHIKLNTCRIKSNTGQHKNMILDSKKSGGRSHCRQALLILKTVRIPRIRTVFHHCSADCNFILTVLHFCVNSQTPVRNYCFSAYIRSAAFASFIFHIERIATRPATMTQIRITNASTDLPAPIRLIIIIAANADGTS